MAHNLTIWATLGYKTAIIHNHEEHTLQYHGLNLNISILAVDQNTNLLWWNIIRQNSEVNFLHFINTWPQKKQSLNKKKSTPIETSTSENDGGNQCKVQTHTTPKLQSKVA